MIINYFLWMHGLIIIPLVGYSVFICSCWYASRVLIGSLWYLLLCLHEYWISTLLIIMVIEVSNQYHMEIWLPCIKILKGRVEFVVTQLTKKLMLEFLFILTTNHINEFWLVGLDGKSYLLFCIWGWSLATYSSYKVLHDASG